MSVDADPISPKPNRGWLWVVLGTVVGVLVACGAVGHIYFHDAPTPDDADLRVRDPMVPEEQNGLMQLRKLPADPVDFIKFAASQGVDEDEAQKIQDGLSTNDKVVDEFLAQAQPAFARLDDILQLPHFAFNDEITPDGEYPENEMVSDYARALRLSARRNEALGDYSAAVGDVTRLRLLARRFSEGHVYAIHVLTACVADAIARDLTQKLLNDPNLPSASAAVLAREFSRDISWTGSLQRSFGMEYLRLAKIAEMTAEGQAIDSPTVNSISQGDPVIQYGVQSLIKVILNANATKQAAADFYRQARQDLNGPYSAISKTGFAATSSYIGENNKIRFWLRPNLIGRHLLEDLTGALDGVIDTIFASEAEDRLLETACALRHYYDDHRELPGKLEDLSPDYLSAVPHDPFDDQSLRYDATHGLVYSVGTSLKDSDGSSFWRMAKANPNCNCGDPFTDKTQPTLQLEFQNPPAAKTPDAKSTP